MARFELAEGQTARGAAIVASRKRIKAQERIEELRPVIDSLITVIYDDTVPAELVEGAKRTLKLYQTQRDELIRETDELAVEETYWRAARDAEEGA